jgi:hypothetical protein
MILSMLVIIGNLLGIVRVDSASDGTFDLDSDGPNRGGKAERGGKRDGGRGGGKGGRGSELPQKSFKRQAKDSK